MPFLDYLQTLCRRLKFACEKFIFRTNIHDAALRHLKSPEEQGVSTYVRTSQFFPCEDVFSSHYSLFISVEIECPGLHHFR